MYINRLGSRLGHQTIVDGMLKDGLWDVYNDIGMGICAELCADQYNISREEQVRIACVCNSIFHFIFVHVLKELKLLKKTSLIISKAAFISNNK